MSIRAAHPALFALLAGSLLIAGACSEVSVTAVPPAVVQISPSIASVQVAATERLSATVRSSDGALLTGRTFTWRSLNPDVADVDADGNVLGIAPGTATIQATTDGVTGSARVDVSPARTIAVPGGVTAVPVSASAIRISWSHDDEPVTGFEVQRAPAADPEAFATIASADGTARAHTDAGLAPGTTYRYRVRACDGASCSGWSAPVSANTQAFTPAVPGDVTAVALSDSEILVTWSPSPGAAFYEIRRRRGNRTWDFSTTVPAGTTQYHDRGLNDETRYHYEVRACAESSCSAYSSSVSAETDD